MPSLREIRRKIKSVKSTQQITKAMKMVAAARMRRAQSSILASRPFAVKMEEAVQKLAAVEQTAESATGQWPHSHPFFELKEGTKECLVLVAADKGLCGAFNAAALRSAIDWLRKRKDKPVVVAVVGRKARDFMNRLREVHPEVCFELVGVFPKIHFAHAEMLGRAVISQFVEKGCVSVDVIYNEFKNVAVQKVVSKRLLPIAPPPAQALESAPALTDYKFEPDRHQLLEALLPRFVKAQLYRILLESQAAELAARMNAMDNAAKNAGELIGNLTLNMNRQRQGIITREIAELVGGAEALAQ